MNKQELILEVATLTEENKKMEATIAELRKYAVKQNEIIAELQSQIRSLTPRWEVVDETLVLN